LDRRDIMTIDVVPRNGEPSGKLADVELQFRKEDGPLEGLTLAGFAVWQGRNGRGRVVTFPARNYTLGGKQRRFVLLRPVVRTQACGDAEGRLREMIVQAYDDCIARAA
jgi:hypothetical protein